MGGKGRAPEVAVVIPAAGTGSRLGSRIPKPLVKLGAWPLFIRTLRALKTAYPFGRVILAVHPGAKESMQKWVRRAGVGGVEFVRGGRTRAESVRNGLGRLDGREEFVLIHDVARPFVQADEIRRLVRAVRKVGAAILALKATATVKEVRPKDFVIRRTLDRDRIYLAQTPQAFRIRFLKEAYRRLGQGFTRFTDEAGMVERIGKKVQVVEGSSLNVKITTPGDLAVAQAILRGAKGKAG